MSGSIKKHLVIAAVLLLCSATGLQAQWLAGYDYRKEIVLDGSQINGTLNNFPVLINITDNDLRCNALSSGHDIVFTDPSNTVLDYELEAFDNATGEVVAWVKLDLAAAVDETIYMYFGNAAAADGSTTATFSSVYDGVYHMADATSATGTFDGTAVGGASAVGGLFGDAFSFDGNNDLIDLGTTDIINGQSSFTISAWVNVTTAPAVFYYSGIYSRSDDSPIDGSLLFGLGSFSVSDTKVTLESADGSPWDSNPTNLETGTGTWAYVAVTYNDATGDLVIYRNGDSDTSFDLDVPTVRAGLDQQIGAAYNNDFYFHGLIDEVRLADSFLGDDWIATEYSNTSDPGVGGFIKSLGALQQECSISSGVVIAEETPIESGTSTTLTLLGYEGGATLQWQSSTDNCNFTDVSGQTSETINTGNLTATTYYRVIVTSGCDIESGSVAIEVVQPYLAGYTYRKKLTLDGAGIFGTHTNFPALINFNSDADLAANVTNTNGWDIVFTDGDGTTLLNHDLESYDDATGALRAWVQMDLTDQTDKEIFMYYGNPAATDPAADADATFDGTYVGVWHFDDPSGNISDTKSGNDATANGTLGYSATGQIGGALDFSGDDYLVISDNASIQDISPLTISFWARIESNGNGDSYWWKNNGTGLEIISGNTLNFDLDANGDRLRKRSNGGVFSTASPEWRYFTVTWNGGLNENDITFYVDGVDVTGAAGADGTAPIDSDAGNDLYIGSNGGATDFIDAILDEYRISNVARSQDWIRTEHFNQADGPAFIKSSGEAALACSISPGTVSVDDNEIADGESTDLTIFGYELGATLQWQSSTDNVSFADVGGQTAATLTTGALSQTTYYRVAVTNGCTIYSPATAVTVAPDFITGYTFRKKITIDSSNVFGSSAHINFPLLVEFQDPDLRSVAQGGFVESSNGYDIIFTSSDGATTLSQQTVHYDESKGSYRGWVNIPSLPVDANTEIYMYYGKTGAADPSTAATWNTDYAGVWHFNGDLDDATTPQNNGTNNGSVSSVAFLGDGRSMDDDTDYIEVADDAVFDPGTGDFTLSLWVNSTAGSGAVNLFLKRVACNLSNPFWNLNLDDGVVVLETVENGSENYGIFGVTNIADGNWHHVNAVREGTTLSVFVDGQQDATVTTATVANLSSSAAVRVGRGPCGHQSDAFIDEVRFINTALSGGWIQTEYFNQNSPASFYTIEDDCPVDAGTATTAADFVVDGGNTRVSLSGHDAAATIQWQTSSDQVTWTDVPSGTLDTLNTGALSEGAYYRAELTNTCVVFSNSVRVNVNTAVNYSFRKKITFSGSEIVGDHDDFPLLVRLASDADLAAEVQNSNGFDIIFTDADGATTLPHEVEFFDDGTGELVAWVKADLTASTDKDIYMYYGNSSISVDPSSTVTWSNDFAAVWHLNADETDATANSNNASATGTSTASGVMASAKEFNGSTDFLSIPYHASLSMTDAFSVTAWAKADPGLSGVPGIYVHKRISDNVGGFTLEASMSSSRWTGYVHNGSWQGVLAPASSVDTNWALLSLTFDGTTLRIYKDGVELASTSVTAPLGAPSPLTTYIGLNDNLGTTHFFDGFIDEVRVASSARTADWVLTEYYNQRPSSTFMTLGVEEAVCDIALVGAITAVRNDLTPGTSTTLSLDGHGDGLTLQWQSSTDGTTFMDVTGGSGETTDTYTTDNLTTSTYYRVVLNNGTCDAYPAPFLVNVSPAFIDGYSYRKRVTVPASKVDGSGNLEDFPLLVSITDDNLRSESNGGNVNSDSGFDLKFADATGTDLDHDLEEYDPVTGTVNAWVRIPQLSGSADNELYLYYGNCTASSDGSSATTWNNGYELVMHMEDATDSKASPYTLTDNGTTAATGQIGSGREFVRSESDNISFPIDSDLLRNIEVATFSAWINLDDLTNRQTLIAVSKGNGTDTNLSRGAVEFSDSNTGRIKVGGRQRDTGGVYESAQEQTPGLTSTDDWYYWTAVIDYRGKSIEFYLDGSEVTMVAQTGTIDWPNDRTDDTPARNAAIGSEDDGSNSKYFDGILDEVRISHVRRSASWIKTEYDNQLDPVAFLTIGEQEIEYQWTGAGGTAWNATSSWSSCEVPAAATNVRIRDVANDPVLPSDVAVANLTVDTGALLSIGSQCLEVTGDLENNGTILASAGTVKFSGSSNQRYTGSAMTVRNVEVNNSGGNVSFFEDVVVEGSMTLTSGSVALEGGNLTVEAGAIGGAGPDQYVITPSSTCLKLYVANSDVFFPIGSIDGYSPAVLNNTGVADTFCIRVIDNVFTGGGETGTSFNEGVVGKTWFIDEISAGSSNVSLTLQWRNADQKTGFDRTQAKITHYNTGISSWEPMTTGAVSDLGSGKFGATATGIVNFSPFGVGSSDAALPVELIFFDGERRGNHVVLTWATATEIDNDFFTVEKGDNREDFEAIATIAGQGDSDSRTDYEHTDAQPWPGNTYYRLKQTDFDGTFTYSNVIVVQDGVARIPEMIIYPNANDGVEFKWQLQGLVPNSQVDIKLFDVNGRLLREQAIQLDAGGNFEGTGFSNLRLMPGIYLLKARNEGDEIQQRLLVR